MRWRSRPKGLTSDERAEWDELDAREALALRRAEVEALEESVAKLTAVQEKQRQLEHQLSDVQERLDPVPALQETFAELRAELAEVRAELDQARGERDDGSG